jgi:8-oxo-dGTP pyrophosphatase MutT (NUDIX family)/GNAT superfamily N-acetyltransferase
MALIKHAVSEVLSYEYGEGGRRGVAKQAHVAAFNYDPRPGYLYVRSRAISSRTNDNFDDFPAAEIEKGYRTFLGKPVFVNHSNEDHRRARGVIIDAALHHDVNPNGTPDVWCEVLMEVDAVRFPKLAEAIVKGHIDKTSMGVDVEYSVCSACGNKATNPAEYCRHIPQMKGSKIIRRNATTGKPEERLIYETCFGLSFFENSLLVEDPADPTAYFLGVDDRGLRMASKTAVRPRRGLGAFVGMIDYEHPDEAGDEAWGHNVIEQPRNYGFADNGEAWAAHPKEEHPDKAPLDTARPAWHAIPGELHPKQNFLNSVVLDHYRQGGGVADEGVNAFPAIMKFRGQHYIDHGTHRLAIDKERGNDRYFGRYHDYDNPDNKTPHEAGLGAFVAMEAGVFWHGSPSGDLKGSFNGLHVGTEEAARQALHARIGEPAEGRWDGTREYGKTLLKGRSDTLRSGYNMEDRPDHFPQPATYHEPVRRPDGSWGNGPAVRYEDRESGKVYNTRGAVYGDQSPVPMDAKPDIFPVRIKGPMTNTPQTPHEDFKANGLMAGQIKRGRAKNGYYYRQVGEDPGSISAVVPNGDHLERADRPGQRTAALEGQNYEGTTGNERHITRNESGDLPTDVVRHMPGVRGEMPGEHRNRQGQAWEDFKSDIARNGIRDPIFVTVDHGQRPRISEGNHRRDAAVELGLSHIPAEVRYFGHAEQQGTIEERHASGKQVSLFDHLARYEPEPDAPKEGEYEMEPDPTGFYSGGIAKRWRQDHHALVGEALHQWKGDPLNAVQHLDHEVNDDPQPDSGSGKQMRAWAGALNWELQNNSKQFSRKLYRGQSVSEDRLPQVGDVIDHDQRPRGYTSNQATARRFAGKPEGNWAGQGRKVPVMLETSPGTHGLRVKDYLGGHGLDWSEQEHILTGKHRVTHVTSTERGLHVKTEPAEPKVAALRAFVAATEDDDDLSTKSPGEIDQRLADHHEKYSEHRRREDMAMASMHHAVGDKQTYITRSQKRWGKSDEEIMHHDTSGMTPWNTKDYESAKSRHREAGAGIDHEQDQINRHNDEFSKRGGWSRFFLVPDGHIHSSMGCHSCRPTTKFAWLPHLSGKSEGEAVEQHGPHLCTHCYPSAPTEWKQDPAETRKKEKQESGQYCAGGKATSYPDAEERARRKAEHPQGKVRLDPGEAMYTGQRGGYQGRCPTCSTIQKVKNSGDFYQHKPPEEPKQVMTPPREQPKDQKPVLAPPGKGVKTHLRSKHNMTTHDFGMYQQYQPDKSLDQVHDEMHAKYGDSESHTHGTPKESGLQGFVGAAAKTEEVTVAGLAVVARDTGRVLLLQRSNDDETDPAAGKWECPGGHLDPGESPIEGAIREWKEELGCPLPPGKFTGSWTSKKIYQGHVYEVAHESDVDINPDDRKVLNPDDPDGDNIEVAAWFEPKDLPKMPALRDEFRTGTDWSALKLKKEGRRSEAALDPEAMGRKHQAAEPVSMDDLAKMRPLNAREDKWEHPSYLDNLKDDVRRNGMTNPVVIMRKQQPSGAITHSIYDGNHRYQVAKELGMSHIPGVVVHSDEEWQNGMFHKPSETGIEDQRPTRIATLAAFDPFETEPIESHGIKVDPDPPKGPWGRGPQDSDEWDDAEHTEVPIHTLVATQSFVHPSLLDKYRKGKRNNKPIKVARENGRNYLIDGHHRAVVAKERGEHSIPALFHSDDGGEPEDSDDFRHESYLKESAKQTKMPLHHILNHVKPTDMTDYGKTWPDVFKSIEDNHASAYPQHWSKFLDHVQAHGIQTPVVVLHRGEDESSELMSGHHRVWAAHKLGLTHIPVHETDDLSEAYDLLDRQAAEEGDWRKNARLAGFVAAWYHGTSAELSSGDMISTGHAPSHNPWDEDLQPRSHVYLSDHLPYVTEHYGPHVYEVDPTGPITHDPEYGHYRNRKMMRSEHPLKVVRKVSGLAAFVATLESGDPPQAHVETAMEPWNGNMVHQPISAAWKAMGAPMDDRPEDMHPERYEPNRGFGVHLRNGEIETRHGTDANGVASQYDVTPYHHSQRAEHPPMPGADGMPTTHSDGENRYLSRVPGSERPLDHVYRIMHEDEYQGAKRNGYFQSDQRMNLSDEGTVASDRSTGSFYATDGPNRIVRLRHHPEDGWKRDSDDYIKTHQQIPFDRADLVSPIIHNNREPRNGDYKNGFKNHFHIEGLEHEAPHLQAQASRPDIGKGWWLTPEGKKIGVYDHYETTPGMARAMIRPHMADSGQVRVRSYNNQLNVQTARPFSDAQRKSLLMDADKHSRMFVDVLHPETEESIHSESGGPEDADRMLARAHRAAVPHTAMAWQEHGLGGMSAEEAGARSVRHAGFKGYVGQSNWDEDEGEREPHEFDEDLYDRVSPEPTDEEQSHYEQHDEYPDSYYERHGQAYEDARAEMSKEDEPDHEDDHLHHWIAEHSADSKEWTKHAKQPQQIDMTKGVYATQSHVGQFHIDRYIHGGGDEPSWHSQSGGHAGDYLGESHPLFVTHQGRLHAIEGHHRVAAALQRGDSHIEGWHHDLDKHPIASDYEGDRCEDCQGYHDWDQEHLGHLIIEADQPYTGDHEFRFTKATPKSMGGSHIHTLQSFPAGSPVDAKMDSGSIRWHYKTGEITGIDVAPQYRRQGLGTELLDQARQVAATTRGVVAPRHSDNRTDAGEAWARSTGDRLPRRVQSLEGFVAALADEHLTNPVDGSKDWHHGTPHDFERFDDEREDDEGWDETPEHNPHHWNTHLGTHWTSVERTAEGFAKGKYSNYDEGPGHIFTANLGIKHPKHYDRESDMDTEAFNHAWDGHDPEDIHSQVCKTCPPRERDEEWDDPYEHHWSFGSPATEHLEHHQLGDEVDNKIKQHYHEQGGGNGDGWLSDHPNAYSNAEEFKQHLRSQGHDGITYGNGNPTEGPIGHTCAITFDNDQIHNLRKRRSGEQHQVAASLREFLGEEEDWRGLHQPTMGPPIHDLHAPDADGDPSPAPDDIYPHMHYYSDGEDAWDSESHRAIREAHKDRVAPGTPQHAALVEKYGQDYADRRHERRQNGDHTVTIYRAAPKGLKSIGPGDWVTPSASYARDHAKHATDPKKDWPVYKAKVPAKHVRWAGDSLNEFGYNGPEVKPTYHTRGGTQAERLAAFVAALDPGQVSETSPEEFHRNFSAIMADSPFAHHVTNHTPEEIHSEGMRALTTNGGDTGVLVHDHGDGRIEATGLYNRSKVKGAGVDLLRHTMAHHGVNYVEAYGPKLPQLYRKAGFQTTEKYRFDREQAHPDWNFRQFDSPSYHIMQPRNTPKSGKVISWPSTASVLSPSPSPSPMTGLAAFGTLTGKTLAKSGR